METLKLRCFSIKMLLLIACGVAVFVCFSSPVLADPVTYTFSADAEAIGLPYSPNPITGSFVFYPGAAVESDLNINATPLGPFNADGNFNYDGPAAAPAPNEIDAGGYEQAIFITFAYPLANMPDPIASVSVICCGEGGFSSTSVSGEALPTTHIPDFEVLELTGSGNCPNLPSGDTGCFDLINNSNQFTISGFAVGNPTAISDSTTRVNWSADVTNINFGSGSESTFEYFDDGGVASNPLGLGSDSSFDFTAAELDSPFEIFANGPSGPVTCSGVAGGGCDPSPVPEPGSLSLLGTGMAMLTLVLRRRKFLPHRNSQIRIPRSKT